MMDLSSKKQLNKNKSVIKAKFQKRNSCKQLTPAQTNVTSSISLIFSERCFKRL